MFRTVTCILVLAVTCPASAESWALVSWVGYEGPPESAYVYLLQDDGTGYYLRKEYEISKVYDVNTRTDPPTLVAFHNLRHDYRLYEHVRVEFQGGDGMETLPVDSFLCSDIHFFTCGDADFVQPECGVRRRYRACSHSGCDWVEDVCWDCVLLRGSRGRSGEGFSIDIRPNGVVQFSSDGSDTPWSIPVEALNEQEGMMASLLSGDAASVLHVNRDATQIYSIFYHRSEVWCRYFLLLENGTEWTWVPSPIVVGGFGDYGRYYVLEELYSQLEFDTESDYRKSKGRYFVYDRSLNLVCTLRLGENPEILAITDEEWLVRQGDGIYSGRLQDGKLELTKLVEQADMKDVHWAVPLPESDAVEGQAE